MAGAHAVKARLLVPAAVLVVGALLAGCGGAEGPPEDAGAAEQQQQQVAPPPAPQEPEEPRPPAPGTRGEPLAVTRVIDGDTLRLADGTVVRLVQIDAPEVGQGECYAQEATAALVALVGGSPVRVEPDPALDQVDRYGRQLAYVFRGDENLNLALVREGAASVWFYRGARGRYADELLAAAQAAEASARGLWGACDATLDPTSAVTTHRRGTGAAAAPVGDAGPTPVAADDGTGCHPAYDPCLPLVADLDCADVRALGKAPVTVRVRGQDPYRLDGDRDGVGCE
jgi:micrococcal nuclease